MRIYKRITVENKIPLLLNFFVLFFLCVLASKDYVGENISIFQYVLAILTNHYYVLYSMVPVLFIIMARYIKGIRDIEVVRYKSYYNQIINSTKTFITWLFLYFISHVAIIFIVGIKTFGFTDQHILVSDAAYDELVILLNMYAEYFNSSLLSVVLCIIYFVFGFTVLFSLLSYINYKYGYKNVTVLSVVVYILMFVGFRAEMKSIVPFVCFNNFILLHHGLFVNGLGKFILVLSAGILIILFCFGKKIKTYNSTFSDFIFYTGKKWYQ